MARFTIVLFCIVIGLFMSRGVDARPSNDKVKCHNECLGQYDLCDSMITNMGQKLVCLNHKFLCTTSCKKGDSKTKYVWKKINLKTLSKKL